MKHIKTFEKFNFNSIKEVIDDLRFLLLELKDNNIYYRIDPNDDISIKILSLHLKGDVLDSDTKVKMPNFSLTIYVNKELKSKTGLLDFPDWFKDTLERVESFMSDYNLNCLYSVTYPGGDILNLDSINELFELNGLEDTIIIDFKKK
jgi:hypothetical protein